MSPDPYRDIVTLKMEVHALTRALEMLIAWLPQSANSPIRADEANALLKILNGDKP